MPHPFRRLSLGAMLLGLAVVACVAEPPRTRAPSRQALAPSQRSPAPGGPKVSPTPKAGPTPPPQEPSPSAGPSTPPRPSPSGGRPSPGARLTFPLRLSPPWGASLVGEVNAGLLGDPTKVASLGSVVQLDEAGRLLANNGGSLIGNHGGGIISDQGGGLLGNHGAGFRLAQAEAEATLPTLPPDRVDLLFQLSKRYALRVVDLTAFIDQAMLAWAKTSPVLGTWQGFELAVTARVDRSATTVPDLFPSLFQGQRLAMNALARVAEDRLQVAVFRGAPEGGLQWLLVEVERGGACRYTYDVGPMTNALLMASPADPKLRLALQGSFSTDLKLTGMLGEEFSTFTAVAEALATQGALVAATQESWRLQAAAPGTVLTGSKQVSAPGLPPDQGRLAMRIQPDGRAVFWVAEAEPAGSHTPRRFQYVAPDGSHQLLQGLPPAWYLGADGLKLPTQADLAPLLPPAEVLAGLKLEHGPAPAPGEAPSPFSWRPTPQEGRL